MASASRGDSFLQAIVRRLKRHIIFNDEAATAVALWIAFAWTHDAATHSPFLLVTSAEMNSGKTTLLGLIRFLVPRPLFTVEISSAVLYRAIEKWTPTLIVDEADAISDRIQSSGLREFRLELAEWAFQVAILRHTSRKSSRRSARRRSG